MSDDQTKIVFIGAGVIGATIGGWIAPHHKETYFLDVGEVNKFLRENGIRLYQQGKKDRMEKVEINVIDDLDEAADADFILLGIKNFNLRKVAEAVKDKVGDKPIIVSMANGIENQRILPRIFSKVIYGVVCYNGWMDEPGVVGYQKRGPLAIGTPDNSLMDEQKKLSAILNKGVETVIHDHIQDAVHSKIVVNLANSYTTLVGFTMKEISDFALFQKALSNLLYEGSRIIKASGYNQCTLGGMPSWLFMKLGAKAPGWLTRPVFKMNLKKLVISSMGQDVLLRGSTDTELESINGYILELADKLNMDAPYNRAVYELARDRFASPHFKPMDVKEVWAAIEKKL